MIMNLVLFQLFYYATCFKTWRQFQPRLFKNILKQDMTVLMARPSIGDLVVAEVDDITGSINEPLIALKVNF